MNGLLGQLKSAQYLPLFLSLPSFLSKVFDLVFSTLNYPTHFFLFFLFLFLYLLSVFQSSTFLPFSNQPLQMYSDWTWQHNCPKSPGAQPKYTLWITSIREERIHTTNWLLCTWMLFFKILHTHCLLGKGSMLFLPIVNVVGFCKMDVILDWQDFVSVEDVPISTRFELILCQGKTWVWISLVSKCFVLALACTNK
jgi:hypothetical protein